MAVSCRRWCQGSKRTATRILQKNWMREAANWRRAHNTSCLACRIRRLRCRIRHARPCLILLIWPIDSQSNSHFCSLVAACSRKKRIRCRSCIGRPSRCLVARFPVPACKHFSSVTMGQTRRHAGAGTSLSASMRPRSPAIMHHHLQDQHAAAHACNMGGGTCARTYDTGACPHLRAR